MAFGDSIGTGDVAALIEEEVSREIIQGVEIESAAMNLARKMRMSSSQARLPILASLPTAYFVASGGGMKQTTKMAWDKKELVAEEIAVIVPIPESYLDDASFDVWAEVRPKVSEAFTVALDAAVLFGVNKPFRTWGPSVYAHAMAAGNEIVRGAIALQDVAGDLSDLMGLVENDGYDVTGHAAKRSMRAKFRNLRDQNGAPIFTSGIPNKEPSTIWGEPVYYQSNSVWDATNADILTGDWRHAILATRQDITVKKLTESAIFDGDGNLMYNLPQQDMIALRFVARFAWQVANPITRETIGTASPFGVMHPAGWTP